MAKFEDNQSAMNPNLIYFSDVHLVCDVFLWSS